MTPRFTRLEPLYDQNPKLTAALAVLGDLARWPGCAHVLTTPGEIWICAAHPRAGIKCGLCALVHLERRHGGRMPRPPRNPMHVYNVQAQICTPDGDVRELVAHRVSVCGL